MALVDIQQVALDVLADHEPGCLRPTAHAADVQAFALAESEIEHARMFTDALAVRRANVARPGRQVARQEFAEIAFADEADAGRILFSRSLQAMLGGDPAYFILAQLAQRESCCRELRLPELVQEITLVLAAILRPQQPVFAVDLVDPRVMAGGDGVCPQLVRGIEEMLELDLAIAQHVRVRRATDGVFGEEVLEHTVPVFARKIAEADRQAKLAANGDGIAAVVLGPAIATAIVGPVLHEQSSDVAASIAEEQGGDRRIHPARNANDDPAAAHASCATSDSGWRLPPR